MLVASRQGCIELSATPIPFGGSESHDKQLNVCMHHKIMGTAVYIQGPRAMRDKGVQPDSVAHWTQPQGACALQLADFLRPRLERSGGLLPMPDAYCLFNRARGTELVSPDDLLQVPPHV